MTKKLGVFVKNASRESTIDSLKVVKSRYLPQKKLIAKTNQLNGNSPSAIYRHRNSASFSLRPNDVGTYIASSSLSHCLDGWGYLSSAANAFLNGNDGVSIHLAYYAELRAIMSILACEGIGVFSSTHIGLNPRGTTFEFFAKYKRPEYDRQAGGMRIKNNPIGTHVFAWEALEKWCRSAVKPSYDILNLFRVNGYTFSELITGFHPLASMLTSSSIAKRWLSEWAFDVKRYKSDRDLRNFVSYRPQKLNEFQERTDFSTSIKNIYELFHVLSPVGSNPFNYLDKLLLKSLFEEIYEDPRISASGTLEDLINRAFSNVGTRPDIATANVLLSGVPNSDTHLIFKEAKKQETIPLPIISRATLLLRIATGFVSKLLNDANISKKELNFVWENYGFNNGFWENPPDIEDFGELWTEIESDYATLQPSLATINNSPYSIRNDLDEDLNRLTQFHRAALWGISD